MKRRNEGFTLIELLMVVLVILMLSALLFRVASLVGDRSLRAKATADIQNMQNALNEFFAEYGTYPPAQSMAYYYENTEMQPPAFRRGIRNPDDPLSDEALGYEYGLASYLFLRDRETTQGISGQFDPIDYNNDLPRDIAAKSRWAHYLKDLVLQEGPDLRVPPRVNRDPERDWGEQTYTNNSLTVIDPWENDYRYLCPPPHLSYRIWSAGPDGRDNTPDDISNASF